mmetsp:Transcript_33603/g.51749  ORF Transcript_33603/g.51749 Transcript_33603/m.51749 type:complete len:211 (-) Transcript_33603:9-641(-)
MISSLARSLLAIDIGIDHLVDGQGFHLSGRSALIVNNFSPISRVIQHTTSQPVVDTEAINLVVCIHSLDAFAHEADAVVHVHFIGDQTSMDAHDGVLRIVPEGSFFQGGVLSEGLSSNVGHNVGKGFAKISWLHGPHFCSMLAVPIGDNLNCFDGHMSHCIVDEIFPRELVPEAPSEPQRRGEGPGDLAVSGVDSHEVLELLTKDELDEQ